MTPLYVQWTIPKLLPHIRWQNINNLKQNNQSESVLLKVTLNSRWYTNANTRFWANQSICKVWSCYVQLFRRRCIYKKVHYFTFDLDLRSRTNKKGCPVSSTSHDLCTCKVWSCYVQGFRRKCIYKKYLIWPWPEGLGGDTFTFLKIKTGIKMVSAAYIQAHFRPDFIMEANSMNPDWSGHI